MKNFCLFKKHLFSTFFSLHFLFNGDFQVILQTNSFNFTLSILENQNLSSLAAFIK